MKAEPLRKNIYDKAKEIGVEKIILRFSGGNDEGYLDIETFPWNVDIGDLYDEIDEWAWEAYQYNGAGDGNDYGDDITYDLKEGKVSTSEWFTSREEGDSGEESLELDEEYEKD